MLTGSLSPTELIAFVALEGVVCGFLTPAMFTTQASLVPESARGAAQIMNTVQGGVGFMAGALLAGFASGDGSLSVVVGLLYLVSGLAIWLVLRDVARQGRKAVTERETLRSDVADLWAALTVSETLRHTVIADLVMRTVVPSTLVAVMAANHGLQDRVPQLFSSGAVGGVVGSVALARRGARGSVRKSLLLSFGGFAGVMVGSVALLTDDWLLRPGAPDVLMLIGAGLATALPTFGIGLLGAMVQQRTPDEIRGKLMGVIAIARLLLQAAVGLVFTSVVTFTNAHVGLAFAAVVLIIAMIGLRGFRMVDTGPAEPAAASR